MAKRRSKQITVAPAESRSAEAATIGWLLSVFTTLACVCGALIARWIGLGRLPLLAGLLLFAGLVIGVISLGLGVVVYRVRKAPPPTGVYVFAVAVAALPIVAIVLESMR